MRRRNERSEQARTSSPSRRIPRRGSRDEINREGLQQRLDDALTSLGVATGRLAEARRLAAQGLRGAGGSGDRLRSELSMLIAEADWELHEARLLVDRIARDTGSPVTAPRPIISLGPASTTPYPEPDPRH